MNNIKVLDCTLRDGGRIIDCEFLDTQSKRIIYSLQQANIDIIEVGFLRDSTSINYKGNSTFFTNTKQIACLLPKERKAMYVAFVDLGMFDFEMLEKNDKKSIDGIRLGFTKENYDSSPDEIIYAAKLIKEKGYKLLLQGVNSLNYTDLQLLELIELVNEIEPYSFGIVDTYGAMYIDDVQHIYRLIDHNLKKKIAIDFHSHNNLQLSFSLAQEIIRLSNGMREVIIDATLRGMGKGAGNTNTELIVDYLIRKQGYPYDLEKILEIIDLEIYDIYGKTQWGYSPASFMAGIYKSHPNNIIYLLDKYSYTTNDIKNILSKLTDKERERYPYDLIDNICKEYCHKDYDDEVSLKKIKQMIGKDTVLVLAPGKSLRFKEREVDTFIFEKAPFIISVNFVSDYKNSIPFFGNKKRYYSFCNGRELEVIVTSDIAFGGDWELPISEKRLGTYEDQDMGNSMFKLLNLLSIIGVSHIVIAGMDGFSGSSDDNYFDSSLRVERTAKDVQIINKCWQKNLDKFIESVEGKCTVEMITPSVLKI